MTPRTADQLTRIAQHHNVAAPIDPTSIEADLVRMMDQARGIEHQIEQKRVRLAAAMRHQKDGEGAGLLDLSKVYSISREAVEVDEADKASLRQVRLHVGGLAQARAQQSAFLVDVITERVRALALKERAAARPIHLSLRLSRARAAAVRADQERRRYGLPLGAVLPGSQA